MPWDRLANAISFERLITRHRGHAYVARGLAVAALSQTKTPESATSSPASCPALAGFYFDVYHIRRLSNETEDCALDDQQLNRVSALFKSLADPARLRILGLLAECPRPGHELAQQLDLTPPTISHHMRRLVDVGLVDVQPVAQSRIYSLRCKVFRDMSYELVGGSVPHAAARDDDAVLRAFFDGPRLRQIPASRKKRVIVLRRLLADFQPDRNYSEHEVNAILRAAHEDVATLRRELVNYGFLHRDQDRGTYPLAPEPPPRGATVRQEVGPEAEWFQELISRATDLAVSAPSSAPRQMLAARRG
jgi:hypothetical protein